MNKSPREKRRFRHTTTFSLPRKWQKLAMRQFEKGGLPFDERPTEWKYKLGEQETVVLKRKNEASELLTRVMNGARMSDVAKEMGLTPRGLYETMVYTGEDIKTAFYTWLVEFSTSLDEYKNDHSLCSYMGIEKPQLDLIRKDPEYKELFRIRYDTLVRSPMVDVAIKRVEDYIPDAVSVLSQALSNEAPWSVRFKAMEKVFSITGIGPSDAQRDDHQAAIELLKRHGAVTVQNNNFQITVPSEYREALDNYLPPDTPIEGEVTQLESE